MHIVPDDEVAANPIRPAVKPRRRRRRQKRTRDVQAREHVDGPGSREAKVVTSDRAKSGDSGGAVISRFERREWSQEQETTHLQRLQRLTSELREEGLVLFLKEIRGIVKSGDQAICLCQLLYWFGRSQSGRTRAQLRKKGRPEVWVAKTYEEFADEVGLTPRQARMAFDALCKRGLVEKCSGGFQGRRTTFWRITPRAIEEAILEK